jgi:DNA-binding Lrp family transcriptional regulator
VSTEAGNRRPSRHRPGSTTGFHYADTPQRKASDVITAIVLLHVDVHAIPETAEAIADIDRVSEVYSVTGDWELVALVRVHGHQEIADVVTGGIAKVAGVTGTHTMIAFQAYSSGDLERLWGVGFEDAEGL